MRIEIKVTGYKEARKAIRHSADVLTGVKGRFYDRQDRIIKKAILTNADKSYMNSPAKDIALESVNQPWKHQGKWHIKNIMSTNYANYRQYGCGGLKIVELVRFTPADIQEMLQAAVEDLQGK